MASRGGAVGAVGKLNAGEIAAHNVHVGGVNLDGEITSAFWKAGEYAVGAGALFIVADIDMVATTTCGNTTCGATHAPLNDNGIYALNTFSFLQENSGAPVPEPGTYATLLGGLGVIGFVTRRQRRV